MKRMAISLVGVMAFSTSAAFALESQTYDLSGFTGVDVSAGYDAEVTVGEAFSVRAETRKGGDLSKMDIRVKGSDLIITRKRSNGISWNSRGPRTTVYITMPKLTSIDTSSGADVEASNVNSDRISLDASSGSDIVVSGTCGSVIAGSSSGADIDARGLSCKEGNLDASSGSDIEITLTEKIVADVSSGADIDVWGDPSDRNVDKSSGGSVSFK